MARTRTTKWVGVLSVVLGLLSSPPVFAQDNERDDSGVERQSETQRQMDKDAQDNPGSESPEDTGANAENMEAQGPSGDDAGFGAGAVGMPEEPIPDDNANKPADTD